jgi:hypothetical protein
VLVLAAVPSLLRSAPLALGVTHLLLLLQLLLLLLLLLQCCRQHPTVYNMVLRWCNVHNTQYTFVQQGGTDTLYSVYSELAVTACKTECKLIVHECCTGVCMLHDAATAQTDCNTKYSFR